MRWHGQCLCLIKVLPLPTPKNQMPPPMDAGLLTYGSSVLSSSFTSLRGNTALRQRSRRHRS